MRTILALVALGMFNVVALAEDKPLAWPQFRGPNGSGVADGQKPPVEFGPDKNLRWKVPVPSGGSSPIVVGDKLVLTAFADGKLWTIAYDRASGKELWRRDAGAKKIEAFHKTESSPANSTPATDGERIVVYFGSCGVLCYDLAGKELWRFDLPTATTPGDFGTGTSPILADGSVIIVRDEMKDAKVLSVDIVSGSLKWEQKRQSPVSYCTPVMWDTPQGRQLVAAAHGRMVGYDLKTGDEKWTYLGMPSGCCSSPMVANGTLYFAGWSPGGPDDKENAMPSYDDMLKMLDKDKDGALSRAEAEQAFGGFFDSQDANKDGKVTRDEYEVILKFMAEGKNSAFALKPGGTGDLTQSKNVLWTKTKGLPYVATAIVYRGQLVTVKDGGIVTAFDAKTGDELYRERVAAPGSYYASPVAANGYLYFTSLDGGAVTVLKAGTPKPEVVAKNPKLDERAGATPAIADDTLYMRTDKHLYAFAVKP
jgi:outer membrane protein assembly factor BamB